jgi:D-tyrosyl-tRNA(Tyr) deacylase
MRLIIQRVKKSSVEISDAVKASIGTGLLILVGIKHNDTADDVNWLASKVCRLRIFNDESGVMNLSVMDIKGEILVISQFTLHASTKKGNRPSYINAAKPEIAIPLYESFLNTLKQESSIGIYSGEFGADMKVSLINDGPVTIFIDSKIRE